MTTADEATKILLAESEIPRQWYNILADLPTPPIEPGMPVQG